MGDQISPLVIGAITPLPPELEALMPEPVAHRDRYNHYDLYISAGNGGDREPLFTADQVRQAILDATERAAKLVESGPPPRKIEGGRVEIGGMARNAFAAAIRGDGGQG
jgi:hypothetical protein